jgi:predicted dehydrogenase
MQFSAVAHVGERGQEQHLVLHGEEGTLEIDVSWPGGGWAVEMRGVRQGEKAFQVLEVPEALWSEAEPHDDMGLWTKASIGDRWFIDAILEDRPAVPTFYDGYRVQAVIDAAVESHEQGTWVAVV